MLKKLLSYRPPTGTDGLEIWFQKIQNEINEIRAASEARDGFLFFKSHRYSVNELLEYPSFGKIHAFVGQIEAIVEGWKEAGTVSEDRLRFYYQRRHDIEEQIGQLKSDIILRKPTFWEAAANALAKFLLFILEKLPVIKDLLDFFGISPDRILPKWAKGRLKEVEDRKRKDSIIEGMWEEEK